MTYRDDESQETFEELEADLSQYIVKYPDAFEIDETIETLRQYVPSKNKESNETIDKFKKLFNYSKIEVSFINKTYWCVSIVLFVLGYIMTYGLTYNPMVTLITLAPVPFLLGLLEVFKGRDQGLLEMEMSCKFSANEIMLSRILIISIFNLFLNSTLTIALLPLLEGISIMMILLLWLTPFTLFTAVALWVSMKVKGNRFIIVSLPIWMVISIVLVTDAKISAFILGLHTVFHLILIGIGTSIFAFQIRKLVMNYSSYEGADVIGINY